MWISAADTSVLIENKSPYPVNICSIACKDNYLIDTNDGSDCLSDLWLWSGEVEILLGVTDASTESWSPCRNCHSHASWDVEWHQPSSHCLFRRLQLCHSTVGTVCWATTFQERYCASCSSSSSSSGKVHPSCDRVSRTEVDICGRVSQCWRRALMPALIDWIEWDWITVTGSEFHMRTVAGKKECL